MIRTSLRTLAVAAAAACVLGPVPAVAVISVDSCRDLDKAGETYVVTADIGTSDVICFRILADRITLDLGGHTVSGPPGESGVTDNGVVRTSTIVKNGTITNFGAGLNLAASTRSTVRAVTTLNGLSGMIIGPNSLVKDCVVQRNSATGIVITGDRVQVEGCLIGGVDDNGNSLGNGAGGIFAGDRNRTLLTRNQVTHNDRIGIVTGPNSTVTHNTVSDNELDGIQALPGSLVSSNTVNDNGGFGIRVSCPGTVTHNTALGNAVSPIAPPTSGNGCIVQHNITGP